MAYGVRATTQAQRWVHHHLRYKVFCQELQYEDPAQHPEQVEYDKYDRNAVHLIFWHEGQWAAAVRLIHPPLPIAKFCELPDIPLVEVSRLVIIPEARGSVVLLKEIVQGIMDNRENAAVTLLIAPIFARRLIRLGIDLIALGPVVEHRGARMPYLITEEPVMENKECS